ncbi:endo-1,4-beta-xylanase [Spirosoma arcticum]
MAVLIPALAINAVAQRPAGQKARTGRSAGAVPAPPPVGGRSLLPKDALLRKSNLPAGATIELVGVQGQPFEKAYHITTGNGGFNLKTPIDSSRSEGRTPAGAVRQGDVLLLSFYTRSLQSRRETGESFLEIRLDRFPNGKYEWPPLLERGLSFGGEWTRTQIPFTASRTVLPGDLSLILRCSNSPQTFELADLTLLNYGQSVSIAGLPRSVIHYPGDAPDAAWRKPAADRIEKYRKGNLTVQVMDQNGKPVAGADVAVRLKKHDFAWGTATSSQRVLDTLDANSAKYRDVLLRNFNKVVLENEMKAKNWPRFNQAQTQKGVAWFRVHGIPVRGHVMVWPSWQHSPHLTALKSDTAALRATILRQIGEQTAAMKGQFVEWDVVNEPYAHDDFLELLGRPVMIDWFRAARAGAPGVKLFLNDYTMFQGEGPGSPSEKFYENAKYIKESGAPIDAIGEQGHIGGTPPGIDYVLSRLDRFSELGMPIQITEFDITSDDDDFKARYLHDFMTALYSHPATTGLIQWGFWAGQHWIPAAALWDKNWTLRAHGKVYSDLIHKTWHTEANGRTDADGRYTIRGFNGDYEVVVKQGGTEIFRQTSLSSQGQTLAVKVTQ